MKTKISPTKLPEERDKTVHTMQEIMNGIIQHGGNLRQVKVVKDQQKFIRLLQYAPLWWVNHDMFLLALDAAESHTEPSEQEPPTPIGFVYFDGELPTFADNAGVVVPHACAVLWYKDSRGRLQVQLYSPPAAPNWNASLMPLDADPSQPFNVGFAHVSKLAVRMVKTMWAMTELPSIAEVVDVVGEKSVKRGADKRINLERAPNHVKIVHLREVEQSRDDVVNPRTSKPYSHRFIVRGFYRNQPYGEGRKLRRRQWIPPYVKGGADKPLVLKETVRVWKR